MTARAFLRGRFALIFGFAAIFAAAFLVPGLPVEQVREWTDAAGPLAPLMFVVIHIVVTIAPFPRAVFTLSAGLLFGPVLGIVLAVIGATVSAVLALLVVRAVGRKRIAGRLTHPAVQAIDRRLERRGWLAVGSLRLIAAVPFSIVNYCAGLSSVRVLPYVLATVVGILPSTISAVILGDALAGGASPVLLIVSGAFIAIGVVGLIVDAKLAPPA